MKVKILLQSALLVFLSLILAACPPIPPDDNDYAAKARQIVDDIYVNDGTDQDAIRFGYLTIHLDTMLEILGIEVVDDPADITSDGPLMITEGQKQYLFESIVMERISFFAGSASPDSITYYSLADVPEYLTSSDWEIIRSAELGDITAGELQGVMDYYIELYENNTTIEREYFAGYLIGAIAQNNLAAGSSVDQYGLDKLQMFLFVIDALTLPDDSPLAIEGASITGDSSIMVPAQAGGARSHWGAGAKKLNIRPVNTKQKVIDIIGDTVKEYSYQFGLTGPTFIFCGSWEYTAQVIRTCRWTAGIIDPGDCSGVPEPVAGITVLFNSGLQEHDFLQPLVGTLPDGTLSAFAYCERAECRIKNRTPGTNNVNGYVEASFKGTDNSLTPPYTIFPARVYLKVTERVNDQIECYQ